MLDKSSEESMREMIATVAGPLQFSDNRKSWLARAARNSGLSFRTVRSLFYGEITDPNHLAVRRLKDAAVEAGRKEARSLAEQFETIAGGLNATDQVFYRDQAAAYIEIARILRGLDRP